MAYDEPRVSVRSAGVTLNSDHVARGQICGRSENHADRVRTDGVPLQSPDFAWLGVAPGVGRDGASSQVSPPRSSS